MTHQYARHLRDCVRHLEEMDRLCERWLASPDPPPFPVRRRLFFARRALGVSRLAFLGILGLLGLAAVR
jgi:hypothetical protein